MFGSMLKTSSMFLTKSVMWDSVAAWALFITVIVLVSIAMSRTNDQRSPYFIGGSAVFAILFVGITISCAIALRPALEASVASQALASL